MPLGCSSISPRWAPLNSPWTSPLLGSLPGLQFARHSLTHPAESRNSQSCLPSGLQVSLPTQYNGQNQAPVGALSGALGRLQANRPLRELREIAKGVTKQLPEPFQVGGSQGITLRSWLSVSSLIFGT